MKLTIPPIEIDDAEPFKHDVLNRKAFGQSLLNLVSRVDEGVVLSIDAPWGEGKTTFVRMWQSLLKMSGIKSVYFDAFANDYVDDPFIAVASEITRLAEADFRSNKQKAKKLEKFKKSASRVGSQLLAWTTRVGVKAATLGVIKDADIEAIKSIKDDLAKGASDVIGKLVEERISAYEEEAESIKTFREALEALAAEINEGTSKPLIIIIDELDRCRPTYAIELIENIKHLFSVRHIVFVLVMHKTQLEESVRCVYGQNVDANTYLQKFITLECTLPKNAETHRIDDYRTYSERLFQLHELETWGDAPHLLDSIVSISKHLRLSLRQMERVFSLLAIFYGSVSENTLRLSPVIALLAVLKVFDPKLFSRLKGKKVLFQEVGHLVGFPQLEGDDTEQQRLYRIGEWTRVCLLSEKEYAALDENDGVKRLSQRLWGYNIGRENIIPMYCNLFDFGKLN